MAKDPAFLFYSQDWITGTLVMSFEDRGKYITILSLMHQQGHLSEETIRFLVGSISVNLMSKFMIDGNGLMYNARLEKEIEKRAKFTEPRRENGKKGGRPKAIKPNGYPTDNLSENENVDDNEIINEKKVLLEKKFVPPKIEDVIFYFKSKGYSEIGAKAAFEYYEIGNWYDSQGKKVKNWKQKMLANWFKPEFKIIPITEDRKMVY